MSEKTYREFLEVESRPYAEFRERIMRHLRRRLLHRRPAKWWRHPKPWQNDPRVGPDSAIYSGFYLRFTRRQRKQYERAVKNGKG